MQMRRASGSGGWVMLRQAEELVQAQSAWAQEESETRCQRGAAEGSLLHMLSVIVRVCQADSGSGALEMVDAMSVRSASPGLTLDALDMSCWRLKAIIVVRMVLTCR